MVETRTACCSSRRHRLSLLLFYFFSQFYFLFVSVESHRPQYKGGEITRTPLVFFHGTLIISHSPSIASARAQSHRCVQVVSVISVQQLLLYMLCVKQLSVSFLFGPFCFSRIFLGVLFQRPIVGLVRLLYYNNIIDFLCTYILN